MARAFLNLSAFHSSFANTRSIPTISLPSPLQRRSECLPNRYSRLCSLTGNLATGGAAVYRFAVIPGDAELDFKKLARASGLRKAEMAPLKDVQPLTGYIRGGVTLFGARKPYPVYIDETVVLFDKMSVSAGARGVQLILSPADYLRAAQALEVEVQTADITKSAQAAAQEGESK